MKQLKLAFHRQFLAHTLPSVMVEITIEIKELLEGSRQAFSVSFRTKKTDDTQLERGLEERILPALKKFLRDSGVLGERAS
jgi:hypothetical protein